MATARRKKSSTPHSDPGNGSGAVQPPDPFSLPDWSDEQQEAFFALLAAMSDLRLPANDAPPPEVARQCRVLLERLVGYRIRLKIIEDYAGRLRILAMREQRRAVASASLVGALVGGRGARAASDQTWADRKDLADLILRSCSTTGGLFRAVEGAVRLVFRALEVESPRKFFPPNGGSDTTTMREI